MALACPQLAMGRGEVLRKANDRSFAAMMNSPDDKERITKWILAKGWLKQFQLVGEVEIALDEKMRRYGQG